MHLCLIITKSYIEELCTESPTDISFLISDEYDKKKQHPNDVYAKNEGLTSGASGLPSRHRDSHNVLLSSIAGLLLLRLMVR